MDLVKLVMVSIDDIFSKLGAISSCRHRALSRWTPPRLALELTDRTVQASGQFPVIVWKTSHVLEVFGACLRRCST